MQQETAPFFSPLPRRMEIPDEDYAQAQVCVAMADALSRTTNHSIYLIDYNRRNFLYVSSNSLFLCGRTPEEVQRLDYSFYLEVVPPEEIQTLQAINEAGFRFYYAQPLEKRMDFIIEYDFHIRASDRHTHLVHHKLTPVLLSPQGDIWLALCVVSAHTDGRRHPHHKQGRRRPLRLFLCRTPLAQTARADPQRPRARHPATLGQGSFQRRGGRSALHRCQHREISQEEHL